MVIEPNHVYVIPPNKELSIAEGRLMLRPPSEPRGLRLPINVLFSSMAQSLGSQAIGVVLSGMGSDGNYLHACAPVFFNASVATPWAFRSFSNWVSVASSSTLKA